MAVVCISAASSCAGFALDGDFDITNDYRTSHQMLKSDPTFAHFRRGLAQSVTISVTFRADADAGGRLLQRTTATASPRPTSTLAAGSGAFCDAGAKASENPF